MNYFFIAGESSGDLHASNLMAALKKSDHDACFSFVGGDKMEILADKPPVQHYREMNYMGLFVVLRNILTLRKIFKKTKSAIIDFKPDVLILVDYAGFNLRIAKFAAHHGIKVFYYISPKVWAWKKSRIKLLKRYVDQLFVIFPFEVDYFQQVNIQVEYHGNPLMDVIEDFRNEESSYEEFILSNNLSDQPIIALLAGSRKQEITHCLPEMIEASRHFPDYQFVVAGAPSVDRAVYDKLLEGTAVSVIDNDTYQLLSVAKAALVTSGTATLETALLNIPQVVVYKTGNLTYRIAKLFVNLRFFSLVNLIVNRELVQELLQIDLVGRIRMELDRILNDRSYREQMMQGYEEIRSLIGKPGVSVRIAEKMKKLLT